MPACNEQRRSQEQMPERTRRTLRYARSDSDGVKLNIDIEIDINIDIDIDMI